MNSDPKIWTNQHGTHFATFRKKPTYAEIIEARLKLPKPEKGHYWHPTLFTYGGRHDSSAKPRDPNKPHSVGYYPEKKKARFA